MVHDDNGIEEGLPFNNGPASSSISRRRSLRTRRFLQSVRKNDVSDVRTLAGEDKLDDPQARDELGRTAVIIAIDKGNYDMIKCLLELNLDVGDALFHAVGIRNAKAVRILCKNLPELIKLDVINCYPSSHYYPVVMTPLLLAGKNDDFEIIKILLQHGAEMPRLYDLISRSQDDSYLKFLAIVHWYEVASSEAYILLTSDDPLDTIFKLGQSLQEAEISLNVPLFNPECERIQDKLADLSVRLLGLARDNDEIGVLLRGGQNESPRSPTVPLRIHQALEIGSFKKFVCHPSSQDYMSVQWEISKPHLAKYPHFNQSYLFNIMIVLLYPILCVGYILLPSRRMKFMKRPQIRFLVHAGSRLTLLCILILSTHSKIVDVLVTTDFSKFNITSDQLLALYIVCNLHPFHAVTILIILWIAGMTVRAVKQLWTQGMTLYFKNCWNVLDFLQLILYWLFLIAGIVSYRQTVRIAEDEGIFEWEAEMLLFLQEGSSAKGSLNLSTTQRRLALALDNELSNLTRYTWGDFQTQLVSEAAFAIANVLSFLQILHHLIAFSLIGPLLISFGGMIYDVLKFFMIFGFLLVSFSIGMTQLYHKFEAIDVKSCSLDAEACKETPFVR